MKINWNYIDLHKSGRIGFINNPKFLTFFKEIINLQGYEKILDVGCGIGTVPRLICRLYKWTNQIYGIDLDQNLIKWGQKHWGRPENIHLLWGNVYNLQFPDNEFDVITAWGLLEFLEFPLKAIKEMIRVINNKGKFVILTIEKKDFQMLPNFKKLSYFYDSYLDGLKGLGFPIENEGKYIQNLFLNYDIESIIHKCIIETRVKITAEFLKLYEISINYFKFFKDFYSQFVKNKVEWIEFIEGELSTENIINFYRQYIGEDLVRKTTIVCLESLL